jgi:hypothetical protein
LPKCAATLERPQHNPEAVSKDDNAKELKEAKMLSALALATVLYSVKPGDALSGVNQHNTSWEAVYDHNESAIQNAGHQVRVIEKKMTAPLEHVQSYKVTPVPAANPTQSGADSASSSGSGYASSDLADIPGVPHSYAACVAFRESTNDTNPAAHGNAYGIIPASGYNVSGYSIAQQKQVFKQIYDVTGPRAWAADGC